MTKLKEKIKRLFIKKHSIYNNIDTCPFWNYDRAGKDLRYLYILNDYEKLPDKYDVEELKRVFDSINMQIIELRGFSNEQKMILAKEKEIEIYKIKLAIGVKVDRVRFQRTLESLEKMLEVVNYNITTNIEDKIVSLEKYMKINIDPKKITIKKWLAYVKNMEEYSEALARAEKRSDVSKK